MNYLTVTSLNRYVRILLENNEELNEIKVIGEISNLSLNRFSGHLYFTLKDEKSGVSAVCFKNSYDKLRFLPKNGMEVLLKGRISLYERDGRFQIIVDDISVSGEGTQKKLREEVKRKLELSGIFSPERKRQIPQFPKNIALITAKDSAAYSDIVNILKRRYPITKLSVYPVLVQGVNAESSIINAIQTLNKSDEKIDLAIIARGGGSQEDLFAFDSEEVVLSASTLKVPFISAVGHEKDLTLLDLVADLRAETPSAAAELATPDIAELIAFIRLTTRNIKDVAKSIADSYASVIVEKKVGILHGLEHKLKEYFAEINMNSIKIVGHADRILNKSEEHLFFYAKLIEELNPVRILSRGYCLVQKNEKVLNSVKELHNNDRITISFIDGSVDCEINIIKKTNIYF